MSKKIEGETDAGSVSFNLGGTISKPDYENIKFNVGVTLPCTTKTALKMMKEVQKIVEEEFSKKLKEYRR